MKSFIQFIIRKRNPVFTFDSSMSNKIIVSLIYDKFKGFLRGLKIILYFKRPRYLFLGKNVSFFLISNINLGKWIKIDQGAYLSGLGKGKLSIGNSTSIGAYSQIIVSTSFNNLGEYIKIGNSVGIGQFASLGGSGGLEIGDNCIIGQYFSCHPENHNYDDPNELIKNQGTTRASIKIGRNCWIGAKVTVLSGVSIGNNCVLAAGTIVTKSIPDNSLVVGVPGKVVKQLIFHIDS